MRKLLMVAALLAASLFIYRPAHATTMEECSHEPTIQSLRACVEHAATVGLIDDAGVAQSLFAKLDAAQAALDRGQPLVAVEILRAFVNEVQAQSGVHIEAEHAQHMIMHAQMVIEALRP